MKALKLKIFGKVQGVGYRRWFEQQALELGLKGYVRNLPSGEVEAVIYGDESAAQALLKKSYLGPLHARVDAIQQQVLLPADCTYTKFTLFRD